MKYVLVALLISMTIITTGCSSDSPTGVPQSDDTTAPGAVSDLAVSSASSSTINLTWTATGDDDQSGQAAAYEIRMADYPTDPFGWENWEVLVSNGQPGAAGQIVNHALEDLTEDTVHVFRIQTRDEAGNQSEPSNPVIATVAPQYDTTAPDQVQDLATWSSDGTSITVFWTATGDDGPLGSAAAFEVRYHSVPITADNWEAATIGSTAASVAAGQRNQAAITGLSPDLTYHIAVRQRDEHDNWSPTSNDLAAETIVKNTWYVKPDGTGDVPTIQAGIVRARPGDTVLVAPGTYTWSSQNSDEIGTSGWGMIVFWRDVKDFTLLSEGGAEVTIIDAQQQNRCMYIMGYNDGIVIDGFTFTNGDATHSPYGYQYGGGSVLHLTSPTIRNCVFANNYGVIGGGISNVGQTEAVLENCKFIGNRAETGGGYYGGGSIPRSVIRDCEFIANSAVITGGGAVIDSQAVDIQGCLFLENTSENKAGGIAFYRNHQTNMTGCTIVGNFADITSAVRLKNTANVTIENCIVADNLGGAPFFTDVDSDLIIGCSNIFGNPLTDDLPSLATDTGGNIFVDPLFVGGEGPAAYRLGANSPCRPENHPDGGGCGLIGAFD